MKEASQIEVIILLIRKAPPLIHGTLNNANKKVMDECKLKQRNKIPGRSKNRQIIGRKCMKN